MENKTHRFMKRRQESPALDRIQIFEAMEVGKHCCLAVFLIRLRNVTLISLILHLALRALCLL